MATNPADSREQFNRQAANYAVSVPHSSGDSLGILTKWVAQGRYELALDIATGPGFTAFAIAPYCQTVIASDIAEGMLKQARRIADERQIVNIRFETIDAQNIPYPDHSIDLITCRTAPHHFPDISKFLAEVHRALKTNGTFLLCDTTTSELPELAHWHQRVEALRDPSHVHAPSPPEWRHLLSEIGFRITDEKATRVDMTFWDWVKRSGTPESVIAELHQDFTNATKQIKHEYGIDDIGNRDYKFHWPVFTCKAIKT